nr:MAG TPA: hypothetical protein [Caudoviricetes sp.]
MHRCDGCESVKKLQDGVWLNPNLYMKIENQQESSEEGNPQRLERKFVANK